MILALDSYYKDDICNTSLVLFANINSSTPIYTDTIYTKVTSEYIPGEFYKRELPGIEKILTKFINEHPDWWEELLCIICDSFCWLSREWEEGEEHSYLDEEKEWAGLGRYIASFTQNNPGKNIFGEDYTIPVIGVAKSNFGTCDKNKKTQIVYRGESKTPLYVQQCFGFVRKYCPKHTFIVEYDSYFGFNHFAKDLIQNMHGQYRIPTMLKLVDQLSRVFPDNIQIKE